MFIVVPAFSSAVRPASRSDRAKMAAALVLTSSNSGRTLLLAASRSYGNGVFGAAATACRRAAYDAPPRPALTNQGFDDDVLARDS